MLGNLNEVSIKIGWRQGAPRGRRMTPASATLTLAGRFPLQNLCYYLTHLPPAFSPPECINLPKNHRYDRKTLASQAIGDIM